LNFFYDLTDNTKEIIYRVLSAILSSFLFTNILPIFMFIIYMKEKAFFSYDFFIGGLFGLNVFFFFTVLLILTFSLVVTSSLFFLTGIIIKKFKKIRLEKSDFFLLIFSLLINILIIYIFIELSDKNKTKFQFDYFIFLSVLSTIISIHFAIVVHAKAKYSIFSLIFFFVLIVQIFVVESKKTADIVGYGLKLFNSGEKYIEIKNINNNFITSGEMLLLSPENVFITTKENNQTSIKIMKRDNIIIEIRE